MIKRTAICLFFLITLVSCEDRYETIDTCIALPDKNKHQEDTIIKDSIQGFYFSRLTKPGTTGLICNYILPNEFKSNELEIVFSGKIRTNYAITNSYINVSGASEDGGQVSWNGILLRYYITDINKWCPFKDSIHLKPEAWNKPFHFINTFSFLGASSSEVVDIDSLIVQVKVKR